ncbi:hypothetical protein C8R47DRAFT_1139282 [Mycena vitilis]|nr:hypothetical protein C8R47DRAFT_1139282 [Mycena vitilis]
MVELLLDHGASIGAMYGDARSMERADALHYASRVRNLELVKCLVGRGARIDVWSDSYGTPLGHAIHFRHLDVVRFLLNSGADTRVATQTRSTLRHCPSLCAYGQLPAGPFLETCRRSPNERGRFSPSQGNEALDGHVTGPRHA